MSSSTSYRHLCATRKCLKKRLAKQTNPYKSPTPEEIKSVFSAVQLELGKRLADLRVQLSQQITKLKNTSQTCSYDDLESPSFHAIQHICWLMAETSALKKLIYVAKCLQIDCQELTEAKRQQIALEDPYYLWIQCIGLYKKHKRVRNLDIFDRFCKNYFNGTNILSDPSLQDRLPAEICSLRIVSPQILFRIFKSQIQDLLSRVLAKPTLSRILSILETNYEIGTRIPHRARHTNELMTKHRRSHTAATRGYMPCHTFNRVHMHYRPEFRKRTSQSSSKDAASKNSLQRNRSRRVRMAHIEAEVMKRFSKVSNKVNDGSVALKQTANRGQSESRPLTFKN